MFGDTKRDMFVSMLYMVLDVKNHRLTAARAGHEPILYVSEKGNKHELIKGNGIVVGVDAGEIFAENLEEVVISLAKDDIIVLYTDGITEAMDAQGREFGRENLIEAVTVSSGGSPGDIGKNINDRLARFTGGVAQHDDMTLLVLKRY